MVLEGTLPSGREKAIETLIDMEPQGAYYRAARVVDDIVPQALLNRPNVVTKAALVEQANSLSEHEINLSNYDQEFAWEETRTYASVAGANANSASSGTGTAASAATVNVVSSKERRQILKHHAKQCHALQLQQHSGSSAAVSQSTTTSSNTTPSPQLVAVLRQIYGTSSGSVDDQSALSFPALLKAVMGHKIFEAPPSGTKITAGVDDKDLEVSLEKRKKNKKRSSEGGKETTTLAEITDSINSEDSSGSSKEDGCAPTAQVESLIANVCRLVGDESEDDHSNNDLLQGLLVAALSVLTQTSASAASANDCYDARYSKSKAGNSKATETVAAEREQKSANKSNKNDMADDPSTSPVLRVGSILSLMKPQNDKNRGSISDALQEYELDAELMDYFAQAAVAHESRIEMQKARLLAKPQKEDTPTEPATTAVTPVALTPTETGSRNATEGVDIPAAATDDAVSTGGTADGQVAVLERDNMDHVERLAEATLASTAALEETISSAIIGALAGASANTDNNGEDSGSGSDSEGDQADTAGSPATDDEDDAQDEGDGDDDSSSSSSADNWAMMDERPASNDGPNALGVEEGEGELQLSGRNTTSSTEHGQTQAISSEDASDTLELNEGRPLLEIPTKSDSCCDDEEDDESSLPPLPTPPKAYPYASLPGHHLELDSEQSDAIESVFAPFFDPTSPLNFGSIPTPNVLVHLLRFTSGVVEQKRAAGLVTQNVKTVSSVPGGIGTSLFPPGKQGGRGSRSGSPRSGMPVTLQLLVAFFLKIIEKREEAISGLRRALAQEIRHAQGEEVAVDVDAGGGGSPRGDSSPLSSEEKDDPAIALAMNYVEDSTAESAESLEAKGMIRKAAAAAHDAAALLSLLRRRTESWKQNVKLYSLCAAFAMQNLRTFLQSTVLERLADMGNERRASLSFDCSEVLPAAVRSKLATTLLSIMSADRYEEFIALVNDTEYEMTDAFMSLILYKQSASTWGECIPVMYPTTRAQVELLQNLISVCSETPRAGPKPQIRKFESMAVMPLLEIESQVHRLQFLCKRLCVADLLDNFVPNPSCYVPEMEEQSADGGSADSGFTSGEARMAGKTKEPFRASIVVSLLASATKCVCGGKDELQHLYLALCHRFHSRVLLWGDLYERSENDVDDVAGAVVAQSTTATGDLVRIGASPSNSLQFDATKCSDSIAILGDSASGANGPSVHQRASKVWGAVLSTQCYSPKTGVHRWAVRLDKCERGHVFVGVTTAQASTRTYVGGDKYGWGLIGTQALWHDRRKIRGDYGATFRTGSTIVVTLDTNAGTLSFSSWKDSSASSFFSLDPLLRNQSSVRRQGHVGGTVDDWGIAFEGLPLDSRLYPAVGLYQRDDRVTLYSVESARNAGRDGGFGGTGGVGYYPSLDSVEDMRRMMAIEEVRRFNATLSWEGVQYVVDTLQLVEKCLSNNNDDVVLTKLLPSLAAALCLVPNSIPVLSERFAITVLPKLRQFLCKLDGHSNIRKVGRNLFRTGIKPGNWVIRATGSSGENSDFEEYVVDFSSATNYQESSIGFEGTGVGTTGKSKNGHVAIFGATKGSSVHFVEEWSDGSGDAFGSTTSEISSCVVAARLSLDGTKFEGTYRNVQFGTSGKITGFLLTSQPSVTQFRLKDAPNMSKQSAKLVDGIVMGQAVLCLGFNHMATIVGEDAAGDQEAKVQSENDEQAAHVASVRKLLSRELLQVSSLKGILSEQLASLRQQYSWENRFDDLYECHKLTLLEESALEEFISVDGGATIDHATVENIESKVSALDEELLFKCGSRGSLRGLCPKEYDDARKYIICAFVRPCHLEEYMETSENYEKLVPIWRAGLKIIEDGLRQAMSNASDGISRKDACAIRCKLLVELSKFLCSLEFSTSLSVDDAIKDLSSLYGAINSVSDIEFMQRQMEAASRRSLLRLISIHEVTALFVNSERSVRDSDNFITLESLVHSLPRVLGRKSADTLSRMRKGGVGRSTTSRSLESQSHFLAGSDKATREAIHRRSLELFRILGRVANMALSRRSQLSPDESVIAVDSLLLSILAIFPVSLKDDEVYEVVRESKMIEIIKVVMSQYANAVVETDICSKNSNGTSVLQKLQGVCQRDISRSLLGASVATAHALIFQMSHRTSASVPGRNERRADEEATWLASYHLVLGETAKAIECATKLNSDALLVTSMKRQDADWQNWCEFSSFQKQSREGRPSSSTRQVGGAGLQYLLENGISQGTGYPSAQQKPSSRLKSTSGPPSKTGCDSLAKIQNSFAFQLLSQWLHVLCGMLGAPTSLAVINKDKKWITLLLGAVGLSVGISSDGSIDTVEIQDGKIAQLPARFRSRIMRFLLPLLNSMKPSDALIYGLVLLAGKARQKAAFFLLDEDEKFIPREAVTLLRKLHSPTRPLWRECVNHALSSGTSSPSDRLAFQMGVLAFLSGSLESIGRGSYVLLKPAAAAPLSVDQQSSPSSKTHSSGAGSGSGVGATPHHLVGNGTEGIVAGLCRHDASAGLVSNIDMKNGICEVVLLTRDLIEQKEPAEDHISQPANGSPHSPRQSLTVRALRTPLADVTLAQEAPLFLDETMTFDKLLGALIESALKTLTSSMGRNTSLNQLATAEKSDELLGLGAGFMTVSSAIMVLRSAIVLLSEKRIALDFLRCEGSESILAGVLRLALPTEMDGVELSHVASKAQNSFLSSLPVHETRFDYLGSMLRDISARNDALAAVSEAEWTTRIEMLEARQHALRAEEKEEADKSGEDAEGIPANATTGSVNSLFTFGGPDVVEANSRSGADSSSNRVASQATSGGNSDEEDEEDEEAAATAAAHLREAAIAQMAELGLPSSWSEFALRRTGGDIEAAVHFLLENGGEMERLLAEERERDRLMQSGGAEAGRRRGQIGDNSSSNHLLRQLREMGFPSRWCAEALAATGNNVDEALTWILTHGERLSEEDEAMEDENGDEDIDEDDDSIEDDDDDDDAVSIAAADGTSEGSAKAKAEGEIEETSKQPATPVWSGSVVPLRFISGRSIIDSKTLSISGLPTGGFSSVGTKGVLLCSGKWYYEATLETAGCLQIGWADGSFAGHCHADRGDGTGDGPSSWAFDGWRRYRWHSTATEWGCRWREGDVVGCLVDMDERRISFTLNGRAEEIGMGIAFEGEGFRPCGGVYACVSFNRREKLRLKLSEPFTHSPPPGYQGVGAAVLEAVKERDLLVQKEKILRSTKRPSPEPKRFLCDFSDGEHGHELMAWAHRYYGSDASVHLGSGRSKQSAGVPKNSATTITDSPATFSVTRRLERAWATSKMPRSSNFKLSHESKEALQCEIIAKMKEGFVEISSQVDRQLLDESAFLSVLLARKLILHLVVTMGQDFDLRCFLPDKSKAEKNARLFWEAIEKCSSLRCAGWVGEAGAMAIAAEALGLGISSNDHGQKQDQAGTVCAADLDEGVYLPTSGITQLLSSVMRSNVESNAIDTGSLLAACAETAIGSDGGGGVLVFLQKGLQSACSSQELRNVLTAFIRRSIRLLAVVEYEGDDSDAVDPAQDETVDTERIPATTEKKKSDESENRDHNLLPDARLASFVTGLLMSKPVENSVTKRDYQSVLQDLFEAWSIGLLSASLPWRMVCAFTVAGTLNKSPMALLHSVSSFPTLARFYGRLESTVARRVWAERAAVPVCSRYAQAMIELLASVKQAVTGVEMPSEFSQFWGKVYVDAATPLPMAIPLASALTPESHWESDDGWVSSDTSWEIWKGTVEYHSVDWETPTRSPVRSLMDGGEGPPMLREGCFVVRGIDWSKPGSGAKDSDDDGKKGYEIEKAKRETEKRKAEEEAKAEDAEESGETDPAAPPAGNDIMEDTSIAVSDTPATPAEPPSGETTAATDTERGFASTSVETQSDVEGTSEDIHDASTTTKKAKKKKVSSPKLAVGVVLSVEPWKGQPGLGRRVRWFLTKKEGVYRYGGDGGRYDLSHVEINEKHTKIKKRYPLPESAEQCSSRHGFGVRKKYNVLLRLQRLGRKTASGAEERSGVLEWPDFGAGVRCDCILNSDGSVAVTEKYLLFGAKDSGWEARFGQPSFVAGSTFALHLTPASGSSREQVNAMSPYLGFFEKLTGRLTYNVTNLRNRADGAKLQVTSEMTLVRPATEGAASVITKIMPLQAPAPPPVEFDRDYHASSLSLSRDGRTVSCVASDGRGVAYASVGFTKGVHYWEVKLEQADIGSVFIGVAEKQTSSGSGGSSDTPPRLNRWPGWGFVNFRATYTSGAERVYGAHCHAGDTVGVLLDCDAGRVSFFFDGLKYGEHILNDLGCAFENLSPFGFNVDGCGSGGAGQGAPSAVEGGRGGRYPAQGLVRPRALWPVIGLRNQGDRVTFSSKWSTSYGVDGATATKNVLAVDEVLCNYEDHGSNEVGNSCVKEALPEWFITEAFTEYQRWFSGKWKRAITRGSGAYKRMSFGLDVDLDSSHLACATASAALGLKYALLAGDRVRLLRSAGRILELAEEAIILGAHQGRLYYKIVSQKSEGGSLTEGGGRAWFFDESEVVDGLPFVGKGQADGVDLPLMDRFQCRSPGGLKVAYEGGAVVRSDLEIIDGSVNLGVIPVKTIIPMNDVLERRVNSCGVTRYRIRSKLGEETKEGWISSRIRGGKEEAVVELVLDAPEDDDSSEVEKPLGSKSYPRALDCALEWKDAFDRKNRSAAGDESKVQVTISTLSCFKAHLEKGFFKGMTVSESDALLAATINAISSSSENGDPVDCNFEEIFSALEFVLNARKGTTTKFTTASDPATNQAAAYMMASVDPGSMPSIESVMARAALLRAFNRRARLALPWMSVRPCQEGSAIFGGLCGHGASTERSGRTRLQASQDLWVRIPSIASRIRKLRHLFFGSVKVGLLQSITEATATPTPLSHDEYELPREIRTVRINRLRSRMAMAGTDIGAKRKYSVFAQLHNETKGWGGAALRRGYVAKGHGGQKRAFKVKLIGEGVNDYSGPYREAFTDAFSEVLDIDPASGCGSLGVLDPTSNKSADLGENRELYMFSLNGQDLTTLKKLPGKMVSDEESRIWKSFSSLTVPRDEPSREVEEALVFLGRLTGTAYRHGISVDLPLPLNTVWNAIAEEESKDEDRLRELDELAFRQNENELFSPLLWWQQKMLNSFVEGLANVLPVEILSILDGVELRSLICGIEDVDVDLLKSIVEYEGYEETDEVVNAFWETLRELNNAEKKLFLQFVWARNRLPLKKSDFEAPFKIQRDSANTGDRADQALPSASTCFFSLALPEYTSKEILREKLLFAINNVTTMETDFQTNSAEIAEGYRTI